MTDYLIALIIDWLTIWLTAIWLTDWLTDWPTDRLTGWLTNSLTYYQNFVFIKPKKIRKLSPNIIECILLIYRFAAVVYPTVYKHRMKNTKVAGWTVLGVWTFSIFIAAFRVEYKKFNYALFVVVLGFFIPLLIILLSYGNIYRVVSYRAKWTGSVLIEIKLARTLSIVIGAFIVCWAPFFITNVVSYYCRVSCNWEDTIQWIKWLQYVSSCINPVIYTLRNREFRFTFHKLVFRCSYRNGKYVFNPHAKRGTRCGCCQLGDTFDEEYGERRSRYPTYTEDSTWHSSHVRHSSTPTKQQSTPLAFDNLSTTK